MHVRAMSRLEMEELGLDLDGDIIYQGDIPVFFICDDFDLRFIFENVEVKE